MTYIHVLRIYWGVLFNSLSLAQDFSLYSRQMTWSQIWYSFKSQQSGQGQKWEHRLWWVPRDGLKASQVRLQCQFPLLWFSHRNNSKTFSFSSQDKLARLGWCWKFIISMSCWSSTICWILPYCTSPPCLQIYLMLMILNPTQGGEREKPKDSVLMLNLRPTQGSFYQSTIGHQDYGRKFFLWNRHIGIQHTIDHFTVESSQTLCNSLGDDIHNKK